MPKDITWIPNVGLIGAGTMGAPIASRLIDAKFVLMVYDKIAVRTAEMKRAGASSSGSLMSLVQKNDIILMCLPRSEAAVTVIEKDLPAILLKEKIIVDLGTTDLAETRRLSKFLKLRNAHFLDAPVAGGPRDVMKGRANIFCGGKREVFDRCHRLFQAITGIGTVTHCGPAGSGQIVKGVFDMATGLARAAIVESVAYGIGQGMERDQLWEALSNTLPQGIDAEKILALMSMKGGEAVPVHIRELPHFVKAAQEAGQELPLTSALVNFLRNAPASVIEYGHSVPSFWNELKRRQTGKPDAT
jgi:3-hydroxyisobutyrate dehydrogenase